MSKGAAFLRLEGSVEQPVDLSYEDLDGLCVTCKPENLAKLVKDLTGEAVWLKAVLKQAKTSPTATSLAFHSADGSSLALPMEETVAASFYTRKRINPFRKISEDHCTSFYQRLEARIP